MTTPDHFVPIAAEVMVWLPGQVAAEVVGQSSIVTYGLAVARLYVQSLIPFPNIPILSLY